ncbi:MAG: transposase [Alphaproteobacteria bacterium]|nr:transposase [Alphaproteobacteria bacterium]
MASRLRVTVAGVPVHVVQRGIDRQACFFTDEDRAFYLEQLAELARACGCAVHAYVLMTNHVHLLLTPSRDDGPSRLMQRLGQRYVKAVNRAYRRTGTLWEGRFRSTLATDESYVLACYRYIEMNPVRAGMVAEPRLYAWSSHRANAWAAPVAMLTPHERFLALGVDDTTRRSAYRELFRDPLAEVTLAEIRHATNGNYPLGSERFRAQIETMLGRRVTPGRSGRPRREAGGGSAPEKG